MTEVSMSAHEPTPRRRSFSPIVVITSPVVVMTALLTVTLFGLWSLHTYTGTKLEETAKLVAELNHEQMRLLASQQKLQGAVGELESGLASQRAVLQGADGFWRERNLIVSGIPERDDENVESMVRELFLKKLALSYDDRDIEEVRRFGRKVPGQGDSGNEGRKILVRFANYRDKENALSLAKVNLDGSAYNIENDHPAL